MEEHQPLLYLIMLVISWLTYPIISLPLPVTYDQRQEGQFNLHAQLENVVVVLIPAIALPELVHQLSGSMPLKSGLPSVLLKAIPSNTSDKDTTIQLVHRDGQKHLDMLPNFPFFKLTDLPIDSYEPASTSSNTEEPQQELSSSSPKENLKEPKTDAVVSASKVDQVLVAESPTIFLQQRSNRE